MPNGFNRVPCSPESNKYLCIERENDYAYTRTRISDLYGTITANVAISVDLEKKECEIEMVFIVGLYENVEYSAAIIIPWRSVASEYV